MTREEAIEVVKAYRDNLYNSASNQLDGDIQALDMAISALKQQPCDDAISRGWNNHQIACLLADMFGDTCACNYNNIDEWLPNLCDFKDTCCPNPVGVACWEQFLKHTKTRYCEDG